MKKKTAPNKKWAPLYLVAVLDKTGDSSRYPVPHTKGTVALMFGVSIELNHPLQPRCIGRERQAQQEAACRLVFVSCKIPIDTWLLW